MTTSATGRFAPWADGASAVRIAELEAGLAGLRAEDVPEQVRRILDRQHRTLTDTLPLYAGTNLLDDDLFVLHDPQMGSRPTMGWPGAKYQAGNDAMEELEVLASTQVAEVMGGTFAEVRLPSATLANLAVYTAFTQPGDVIATLSTPCGGHTSHHGTGVAAVRGLRIEHLPWDTDAWDVDVEALPGWLDRTRPPLVVIGASLMLAPHRLPQIAAAVHAVGAVLVYDASHVAGLVAGSRFQRPLQEGADLLTFSTYKSFGAPAGGAVVTNDAELARRVSDVVYPVLTANYDASRLAPLAVRAAQLQLYGESYADRCISAAQELETLLVDNGLRVPRRTQSHHVAVDVGQGPAAVAQLSRRGIQTSAIHLPDQREDEPPAALRLGTQELVRRGLDRAIPDIAALVVRALAREDTDVRAAVADVMRSVCSGGAERTRS